MFVSRLGAEHKEQGPRRGSGEISYTTNTHEKFDMARCSRGFTSRRDCFARRDWAYSSRLEPMIWFRGGRDEASRKATTEVKPFKSRAMRVRDEMAADEWGAAAKRKFRYNGSACIAAPSFRCANFW